MPGRARAPGSAEAIRSRTRLADVVTSAQAFHWFDHDDALPEIARVLRRRARALVWNSRDDRDPWMARLRRDHRERDGQEWDVIPVLDGGRALRLGGEGVLVRADQVDRGGSLPRPGRTGLPARSPAGAERSSASSTQSAGCTTTASTDVRRRTSRSLVRVALVRAHCRRARGDRDHDRRWIDARCGASRLARRSRATVRDRTLLAGLHASARTASLRTRGDGLDVVAVGVEQERGVVAAALLRAVLLPHARRAVVRAPASSPARWNASTCSRESATNAMCTGPLVVGSPSVTTRFASCAPCSLSQIGGMPRGSRTQPCRTRRSPARRARGCGRGR